MVLNLFIVNQQLLPDFLTPEFLEERYQESLKDIAYRMQDRRLVITTTCLGKIRVDDYEKLALKYGYEINVAGSSDVPDESILDIVRQFKIPVQGSKLIRGFLMPLV